MRTSKSALVIKIRKWFLKPELVVKYLDKKTFYVLNRFGASVRKTSQRSMRTRKGKSEKGEPPYSHGRKQLRKLLFYSLERRRKKNVVIGPLRLQETSSLHVPKTHEEGGVITKQVKRKRKSNRDRVDTITSRYPPRPYMKPAFDKFVGQVASWYAQGNKSKAAVSVGD